MTQILQLSINGEICPALADPRLSLLDWLRDHRRLTGTKAVCREGFCGACTVHIDGEPVPSCLIPIGTLPGKQVTTIEGIAPQNSLNPVQQAFIDHDVVQCGMCFPGMVMTFTRFIDEHRAFTREEVKSAMTGNICRCTGYERIIDALMSVQDENGVMA